MSKARRCRYCQSSFLPSPRRPQQRVCGQPECQSRRRADSRRRKLVTDPEYGQVVRDSRKKWREEHPDYQRERRKAKPELVEKNRQQQHFRDQKRRLVRLDNTNLVLDLKPFAREIWLISPEVPHLDRNNLVSAQVLILPSVTNSPPGSSPS